MSDVIRPSNARMKVGLKPAIRNVYAEGVRPSRSCGRCDA
jgi:hypothetical protein